jgi:hypothetical protein
MNARETAERHGRYVMERNWQGVGADFAPGAMDEFQKHGKMPPRGTSKAEFVKESQEGDDYVYDICYTNDTGESLTVRSRWSKIGDEWKIKEATPL